MRRFYAGADNRYAARDEMTHILMKVETHNHPTAIAPFPGAATGSGGEIRDEGATGIGARPKAGLTRLHRIAPEDSKPDPTLGSRSWQARPYRFRAADHAPGPDRRRGV